MPFLSPNFNRPANLRPIFLSLAIGAAAAVLSGCGGSDPASPVRFVDGGIVVESTPGSSGRVIAVTTPDGATRATMVFPENATAPVFVPIPWLPGETFDVAVRAGSRRVAIARATAPRDLPHVDVRFDPPAIVGSDDALVLQPAPGRQTVEAVVRVANPSAEPAVAIVRVHRDQSMTWEFPERFSSADAATGLRWTATSIPSCPEVELRFRLTWAGEGEEDATGGIEWTVPGGTTEPRTRRIPLRLRPPARD